MSYMSRYRDWLLSDYFDESTKAELEAIKENEAEIEDRFYKNLDFGTGGMRGKMGAGTNRINKYTVRKATQGLANYIINYSDNGRQRGVVIAYDSRHNSAEFALEAALVLAANGIKTFLFSEMRPTPELSFAVRHLNAVGGIVITASHNPPEYNGYKVYWQDGGQVVPAQARDIIAEIEEIDDFAIVKTISKEAAQADRLLKYLDQEVDAAYQQALIDVLPQLDLAAEQGKKLKVVYTPLHGTGSTAVPQLLKKIGFTNFKLVKAQADGDPEFSTVESPNPEDRSAFKLALELAEQEQADLILATDPDADRMAAVVKTASGEYQALNGNETGVLFTDYLLNTGQKNNSLAATGVIVKTIVSTEMAAQIAAAYNIEIVDVLTGFKYIGEKITEFEKEDNKKFLLGFEESLGYLIGEYARDKDAVVAAALFAIMALSYQLQNKTVLDRLAELRAEYGYYLEDLESLRLEGKEGQEKISKTINKLREELPTKIAGRKVVNVKDYQQSKEFDLTADTEKEIKLPKSNVLQFLLADQAKLTIRPSGTEPKLKLYFAVCEEDEEQAEEKLAQFKAEFMEQVEKLINSF
ncbi:phospho-sugar mutase [Halanaerobium salsuginis]|uniref:Phosphoglucomutase n=1 Tax=Halanaerobium salsuginis TaxID=29563 RepID=A0A1I4FNG3_9FIRM|nr:phospho-sugar mutase [Halanaerobium salsuginis]SFL18840.1 alpha-phosphoglucomutase [Halanaerobium salsuginis]